MGPMSTTRDRRATKRRLIVAVAALALVAPLPGASAQPDQSTVPGKDFAAYDYGWYPLGWAEHFDTKKGVTNQPPGPPPRGWVTAGTGTVWRHHGVFSVDADDGDGDLSSTLRIGKRYKKFGRWEIRFRARHMGTPSAAHEDYTVAAELVPARSAAERCGARNIALASYRLDSPVLTQYARGLPDRQFQRKRRGLKFDDYWHTYAVEVSRQKITWFVDSRPSAVVMRKDLRARVPMTLRFSLKGVAGAQMNETKAQVDTVRYFSMKRKAKKRYRGARKATYSTYSGGC